MASRFVAPKRLESMEDVRKAFQLIQEQLDSNGISRARGQLVTTDTTLAAGEYVRISPRQGATLFAKLPKATAENIGAQIAVSVERPNGTLRIAAQKPDTVAGLATAVFTTAGLVILQSNGTDQWSLINQLPANSPSAPVLDAEYVVGAADVDLPNGRVATDSTEIDAVLTTPNAISWALNVGSVALSKLANLTGLSVLGRAANSAGVMAAITATAARQVLAVNDAGTALAWQNPVQLVSEAGAQVGKFHSIRFHGGTHTTASSAIPGGAFGTDTAVVIYNVNATTLAAALAGAGMTASAGVMNVIGAAGGYITVGANDVAWQGFDLDLNTTGSPSTGWKGLDLIDSTTATWNVSAPGGGRVGLSINADPDSEVTIATTGNLDLTFADVPAGTKRLTLTGAAPVLRSIEGGTSTGRKLKLYYNGSGTCIVLNSSATGASGNESRIFNPDNAAVYLFPRQGATIQANGTLGWRLYVDAMNRNHTAGDGVNPPNTFSMFDANGDFNFGNAGSTNGFIVQTGLGVGGTIDLTARLVNITASGDDVNIDSNANMNLSADRVRLTSGAAFVSPGFLSFLEGSASTPTVPAGDGMIWVQNTTPSRLMYTHDENTDLPINVHCVATKTTTTTNTTATPSDIITYTRPANTDRITTTYRLKAKVLYNKGTAVSTTSPVFIVAFGGTAVATLTLTQNTTVVANQMIDVEAFVTIRTLGAAGVAVHSTMMTAMGSTTLSAVTVSQGVQVQAGATVSTTISQSIDLRFNLAAAVATHSVSCNCATIERLD